jgi:hypothetical protein
MDRGERNIIEVVQAFSNGREEVAVVRCSDGTCGIACNGELLGAISWQADQLTKCIEFAERFARTSDGSDGN